MIKISIVFDNNPADAALRTGFGFACVVETPGKKILFDTGSDGDTLLYNLDKLNILPTEVDAVVVSHNHWDHTGGLEEFLRHNPDPVIYLPASFPGEFVDSLREYGAAIVRVDRGQKIGEGINSTGELSGPVNEQSLICSSERGLVVVTGCAHPGILHIVEVAKAISENVYLVMGGFHLRDQSISSLRRIVDDFRQLGVVKVCPCHCTGDAARALFAEAYGGNCVLGGVGTRIEIGE